MRNVDIDLSNAVLYSLRVAGNSEDIVWKRLSTLGSCHQTEQCKLLLETRYMLHYSLSLCADARVLCGGTVSSGIWQYVNSKICVNGQNLLPIYACECSVVLRSAASVCLSVRPQCSSFWKLLPRKFIFDVQVRLHSFRVSFIYQRSSGQIKVIVFASGLP